MNLEWCLLSLCVPGAHCTLGVLFGVLRVPGALGILGELGAHDALGGLNGFGAGSSWLEHSELRTC